MLDAMINVGFQGNKHGLLPIHTVKLICKDSIQIQSWRSGSENFLLICMKLNEIHARLTQSDKFLMRVGLGNTLYGQNFVEK